MLGTTLPSMGESLGLHEIDLTPMRQGWGVVQVNRSMREKPLSIAGRVFAQGLGTHAHSSLWLDLGGKGERDGGDGVGFDHGDWAEVRLVMADGAKPVAIPRPVPKEDRAILTPKPGPAPRINGPAVYGCRPGNPFLYRIPTQGERPIEFAVERLPEGLRLDPSSGILAGTAPRRGEHEVILVAKNRHGTARRPLRIVAGDTLALTPPMGYNHWYAHYDRVTDAMMRQAADVMVSSGMADVGYQYVNIDDCWMNAPKHADPMRVGPLRDASGNILPNRHFPDMKALTDYIHGKGLKAGTYTSPGPLTCGGFAGAWQHEAQDARQFAAWGFDFLKYDWCSYGEIAAKEKESEEAKLRKPYLLMGDLLKSMPRDIVFNLCQYGMGRVWEWGESVGGQCWRTAGDLGFELDRIFEIAIRNAEHRAWSKPGSWNDPDYLQIGWIGNAQGMGRPKPCDLTPSEQYAFMSLWCLSAAPLIYSGDMAQLDDFTIGILANPEVIEIDQDPLGRAGRVVLLGEKTFAMIKEMADGTRAVGLGNLGEFSARVSLPFQEIGLSGAQPVRDPWRWRNLEPATDVLSAEVGRHAVMLLRVGRGAH